MIFKNDKITKKGIALNTIKIKSLDSSNDVLKHLFDGKYNKNDIHSILIYLNSLECIKEIFDKHNLSYWYFQDIDGNYKPSMNLLSDVLELFVGDGYETITISHTFRNGKVLASDIIKDYNDIKNEFKNVIKEILKE